jgi:radical SAM/Cys-rich protein
LRKLNAVGYGSRLPLNLVYNPLGPKLPPPQSELESDYRGALRERYGIEFTNLFTLTNQPIARFAEDLRERGAFEEYLELLADNFNPSTVEGLMCRTTLSVGWRGELYDCDFNQMLGMHLGEREQYLWEIDLNSIEQRRVETGRHCFACTAGSGSSCGGALVSPEELQAALAPSG